MARDIEKEQERIRTGNRFVTEVGNSTGVFPRDIDALFVQYENLRNKVYSQYSISFNNNATREELRSYIDEEFIKLCKEYEINGEVDFPYYIKTKLNARVDGTFRKRTLRHNSREPLGTTEDEVEGMLDKNLEDDYNEDTYQELVQTIVEGVQLSPLETELLARMLEGGWTYKQMHTEFGKPNNISRKDIQNIISELQQLVSIKLGYHS